MVNNKFFIGWWRKLLLFVWTIDLQSYFRNLSLAKLRPYRKNTRQNSHARLLTGQLISWDVLGPWSSLLSWTFRQNKLTKFYLESTRINQEKNHELFNSNNGKQIGKNFLRKRKVPNQTNGELFGNWLHRQLILKKISSLIFRKVIIKATNKVQ